MAQPLSNQGMMTGRRPAARAVLQWAAATVASIMLLAALALWAHYGTAVFFEMIATGFAGCF